jgi:hypothetical protein
VNEDATEFTSLWDVDFDELKSKEYSKQQQVREILKGVFGKMKSLGSEESDLSMSQQKNEMRNLFTEAYKPDNLNEASRNSLN